MKPTVITSGNSGNGGNPQVIPQNTKNIGSGTGVSPEPNVGAPSHGYSNSREFPSFQRMGFDPDDDDMFSDARLRSRLGRMTDPFSRFDAQFGSLGSRRRANQPDSRFFENIPSEFRQYIPEGFGFHSRHDGAGGGGQSQQGQSPASQGGHPQQQEHSAQGPQYYQTFAAPGPASMPSNGQSPQSKTLCDAAIQTEDLAQSQADGVKTDNLNQHGLRNTVDLGISSPAENENRGQRAHSAPPQDQGNQNFGTSPLQNTQQAFRSQGTQQNSPPPQQSQAHHRAHAPVSNSQQPPQFPKSYYPPQGNAHSQQQPAAPTTPGGSYVRTIPIFVEGRSEPIINHKEIPAQYQQPSQQHQTYNQPQQQAHPPPQPQAQHYQQHQPQPQHTQQPTQQPTQQHQQHHQHRPSPLNTDQQIPQQTDGKDQAPPQTPHTMASINKIQDIQRDVLDLMMKVEKFTGIRSDKEYAYLDEMLTRNLLKLDTIDTNGKESIRLARKEAIKCIQASINVLEAKAKGNAKTGTTSVMDGTEQINNRQNNENSTPTSNNDNNNQKELNADKANVQEPIPLPPPTHGTDETVQKSNSSERTKESSPFKQNFEQREFSPSKNNENNEQSSQNSTGTKD